MPAKLTQYIPDIDLNEISCVINNLSLSVSTYELQGQVIEPGQHG